MTTHSVQHHNIVDLAAMKNEIENIKTHFAPTSEVYKWTVGVGAATILSITGVLTGLFLSLDTHIARVDTRLTDEIRDMRRDMKEMQRDMSKMQQNTEKMRQEVRQNTAMLAEKIDGIGKK